MKLAIFVDQIYWFDGQVYSTDEAYMLFAASFADAFEQIIFIGRLSHIPGRKPYILVQPAITICALPYYDSVYNLWKAGNGLREEIRAIIRANVYEWDVVWICGPNPVGQMVAELCIRAGRPVFLVVRQNLVRQMRFVNRGARRVLAMAMAAWLEWEFQRLARGRTVFAVGQEMTDVYSTVTKRAHLHFPCLVSNAQMDDLAASGTKPAANRLLCVGRLSSEKGYRYLLAALKLVRAQGLACSLDIVGSGPLDSSLRAMVATLDLAGAVTFHGYLTYGPELLKLYQQSTIMVVPSLSEGFPQVISEALCVGLPTIASRVGGIPALLIHGETALLVPPANVTALATAITQLLGTPELRERLRTNGQKLMRQQTLEANRDRMLQVIYHEVLAAHS